MADAALYQSILEREDTYTRRGDSLIGTAVLTRTRLT